MNIDDKLLARLEKLSSLKVDDSKKGEIEGQLSEIVNFVDNLSKLDVSQIDATFSTIEGGTPMREDNPKCDTSISEDVLKNAPKSENGFFIVPKIIE